MSRHPERGELEESIRKKERKRLRINKLVAKEKKIEKRNW